MPEFNPGAPRPTPIGAPTVRTAPVFPQALRSEAKALRSEASMVVAEAKEGLKDLKQAGKKVAAGAALFGKAWEKMLVTPIDAPTLSMYNAVSTGPGDGPGSDEEVENLVESSGDEGRSLRPGRADVTFWGSDDVETTGAYARPLDHHLGTSSGSEAGAGKNRSRSRTPEPRPSPREEERQEASKGEPRAGSKGEPRASPAGSDAEGPKSKPGKSKAWKEFWDAKRFSGVKPLQCRSIWELPTSIEPAPKPAEEAGGDPESPEDPELAEAQRVADFKAEFDDFRAEGQKKMKMKGEGGLGLAQLPRISVSALGGGVAQEEPLCSKRRVRIAGCVGCVLSIPILLVLHLVHK